MNLLALLFLVAFTMALFLSVFALVVSSRETINWMVALLSFTYAIRALCSALIVGATSDQNLWLLFRIGNLGYILSLFFSVCAVLIFAQLGLGWRLVVLVPLALISLVEIGATWSDWSIIDGFRRTSAGWAAVVAGDEAWYTVDVFRRLIAGSICLLALFNAWRRTRLRRSRRITFYYFVSIVLAGGVNYFCAEIVWRQWSLPDPSVAIWILGAGVYFHLTVSYRHLRIDYPMIEKQLIYSIHEAVVLVDPRLAVLKVNPAAERLLGQAEAALVGQAWPAQFRDAAAVTAAWQAGISQGRAQGDLPCAVNDTPLLMTLLPTFDRFHDLIGGVAIVRGLDVLDAAVLHYGLTQREREIFLMVLQGYDNQEIAAAVNIAAGTVKNHIHHIYEKTGATTRIELFRRLLRNPD